MTKSTEEHLRSIYNSTGYSTDTTIITKNNTRTTSQGYYSYWDIYCKICSVDEFSLAGLCTGRFESFVGDLKLGKNPCRCSNNSKLTKEQREYLITKKLDKIGAMFLGWKDYTKTTVKSKVIFVCKHGHKQVKSCEKILTNTSKVCDICVKDYKFRDYIEELTLRNHTLISLGKTMGDKSTVVCENGHRFKVVPTLYLHNNRGCKVCSKKCKEVAEDNFIKEVNLAKYSNKGFYKGAHKLVTLLCNKHHTFKVTPSNFVHNKSRCPECRFSDQKEFYLTGIYHKDIMFAIKFGITSDTERRRLQQQKGTKYQLRTLKIIKFDKAVDCRLMEKFIKNCYPKNYLNKHQYPDGYTETRDVVFLDDILGILQDVNKRSK